MIRHSIIIPTSGRPLAIRDAIESVLAQNIVAAEAELIVVDNNTDDQLASDLDDYCTQWCGLLRYVREPSPGLSAARHRGAAEAYGELLTYLDDDVVVSATWLGAIHQAFADPAVAMVGGPSIPKFTCSVPDWFWGYMQPTPYGGWMNGWLSLIDLGKDVPDYDPNLIWGLNFSIRKQVLYDCGGFHPDLVPAHLQRWQGDGETGLTIKFRGAGLRATYRHDALLSHLCGLDRLNVAYFKKRAYFQGVCDSFTRIRAGMDPQATPAPMPIPGWYRRLRGSMGQRIRRRFCAQAQPWAGSGEIVSFLTSQAYQEGWLFHQRAVAADPLLLAWVRRTDFFDTDIRQLAANQAYTQ